MMSSSSYLVLLIVVGLSKPCFAVFVSIDCGASDSYVDENNNITWVGDDGLIHSGESRVLSQYYAKNHVISSLRVFSSPSPRKNCYTINNLEEGERVLVRATFFYGNYDGKSSPPTFDLLFDGNYWRTVNLSSYATNIFVYDEAIYVIKGNATSICVAQTLPDQLPFISALELRTLDSETYTSHLSSNYVLFTANRAFYSGENKNVRNPDDPYDRIWRAYGGGAFDLVTSDAESIDVSTAEDDPPPAVVRNAVEGNRSYVPVIDTKLTSERSIFITLYFSEVIQLSSTQTRSIQIYIDKSPYGEPIIPPYGSVFETYITNITASPDTVLAVDTTSDSTLPSLINAYEVYTVGEVLAYGTDTKDVEGLVALRNAFDLLLQWSGDPCLPRNYSWEWLQCTTAAINLFDRNTDAIPRVIALNLSGFGLRGSLPDFSSMDKLQTIDLHNNSIDGPIPEFLGSLPNLELLNLADNRFEGSIPTSLSKNKNLKLFVTGNCLSEMSCPPLPPLESPPPVQAPPPPLLSSSPSPQPALFGNTPSEPEVVRSNLLPALLGGNNDKLPIMVEARIAVSLLSLLLSYF